MTVLTQGRVRTFLTIGTTEDQWDGSLSVAGTTLTSTPQETTRPTRVYELTLSGDQLTLTDASDEFDFTQSDAAPVSATMTTTMNRE